MLVKVELLQVDVHLSECGGIVLAARFVVVVDEEQLSSTSVPRAAQLYEKLRFKTFVINKIKSKVTGGHRKSR